jgi:hypothetical protein
MDRPRRPGPVDGNAAARRDRTGLLAACNEETDVVIPRERVREERSDGAAADDPDANGQPPRVA